MTVFYDDDCGLCTCSMRLLKHLDINERLDLRPLTSPQADKYDIEEGTVALVIENKVYVRSEAIRLMLWNAGGVAKVLSAALAIIPVSIGDYGYRLVARNRHRFFGGACKVSVLR